MNGIDTTFGRPAASIGLASVLGFAAWPAVEHLVHGVLSHRFRTFVTPLLAHHDRDAKNDHGVSTRFFDRLMRTLPDRCEEGCASVAGRPLLARPEDTFELYRPGSGRALRAPF